jgi:microsomal dipeptidase-like Zn-dependent dipeptidase
MKNFILMLLVIPTLTLANEPIKGYADLHVHMFANNGFAGAWFTGDPTAETREEMFKYCAPGEKWPWLKEVIAKISPYVSSFLYRNHCVPQKVSFPQWNDLAHQQVWKGHLNEAHARGLKLMVLSAVHSYVLCRILPDSRKDITTCEDRPNVLRQLRAANKFIQNQDWVEVAKNPQQARNIINNGKLAVVLSVETSNIFDGDDWKEEFQDYWDAGARTLQIVHQFDNKMAGAAIHKPPLKLAQYIRNKMRYDKFEGFDTTTHKYKTDFGTREVEKNNKGLSASGAEVITEMMDRGMAIDFAHMSEKTMDDALKLLMERNYPFYISHGHLRDVMKGGLGRFEKSSGKPILRQLTNVNGVFGLRTITYGTHTNDSEIPNNCDGTSMSFAQMVSFANEFGLRIAYGSDFNGFIGQSRPRFSKNCPAQVVEGLGREFDKTGLGRVDQLQDLHEDIQNLGVDVSSLDNSAEYFIDVWERSYNKRHKDLD